MMPFPILGGEDEEDLSLGENVALFGGTVPALGVGAEALEGIRQLISGFGTGRQRASAAQAVQRAADAPTPENIQTFLNRTAEIEGDDELGAAIATGSITEVLKAAVRNPSGVLARSVGESFGVGPHAVVMSLLAPVVGSGIGAADVETQIDLAENVKEEVAKRGQELSVESLQDLLQDRSAVNRLRRAAIARGVAVGATEAAFGGISGRFTGRAGGNAFVNALLGLGTEAAGESAGEAAGQLTEGRFDVTEILAEGLLVGPQSVAAATGGLLKGAGAQAQTQAGATEAVFGEPVEAVVVEEAAELPLHFEVPQEPADIMADPEVALAERPSAGLFTEEEQKAIVDETNQNLRDIGAEEDIPIPGQAQAVFEETTEPVEPLPVPAEAIAEFEAAVTGVISMNRAELDKLLTKSGAENVANLRVRQSWTETIVAAVTDGYYANAQTIAENVVATPRLIDAREYAGLMLHVTKMENRKDILEAQIVELIDKGEAELAAAPEKELARLKEDIGTVHEAAAVSGIELGRAFSQRRMAIDRETFSPQSIIRQAVINKKKPLTPEEKSELITQATELEKVNKKVEEGMKQAQEVAEELAKDRADRIVRRLTVTKERLGDIVRERNEIKKELANLGVRINSATGVPAEVLYYLGKLALNYAKGGALSLEKSVLEVINDPAVRKTFPGLEPYDVYQAINMANPSSKAKKRRVTEAQKETRRLKSQARMLQEVHELENGLLNRSRTVRSKRELDPEVRKLKEKLVQLKKSYYTDAPTLDPADFAKIQDELSDLLNKLDDYDAGNITLDNALEKRRELRAAVRAQERIDELQGVVEKLRRNEPVARSSVFKKRQESPKSPSLEKLLQQKKDLESGIRRRLDDIERLASGEGKIKYWVSNVAGLGRAFKASLDLSGTFLQGGILLVTNPLIGGRAFSASARAAAKTLVGSSAEGLHQALFSNPDAVARWKAAKLEITGATGGLLAREEAFGTDLIDRWRTASNPVWRGLGKVLTQHVKASEAGMTMYLNYLRAGAFENWYHANNDGTLTTEDIRRAAQWINITTGRGELSPGVAMGLAPFLFAPRFTKSRLDLINPVKAGRFLANPRTRKIYARDMSVFVGSRLGMLYLLNTGAAALGIDVSVGMDPRESDFLKLVVNGKTRIDIFNGIQQVARLLLEASLAGPDRLGITGRDLRSSDKNFRLIEEVSRFISYKASPAVGVGVGLIQGKNVVGEPRTIGGPARTNVFLRDFLTPLTVDELWDAGRDVGFMNGLGAAASSFVGIPVSTYGSYLSSPQGKELLKDIGYKPGPPRYPPFITDPLVKKELDVLFEDRLGQKLLNNRGFLERLPETTRREIVEDFAKIERDRMLAEAIRARGRQ